MKHLTRRPKDESLPVIDYVLFISVPPDEAEEISAALVAELGEGDTRKKSAFVRRCVISGVQEPVYQARNAHALRILKSRHFADENHTAAPFVLDVIKALTGCSTGMTVEFTGESDEYREFWDAALE